MELTKAAYNILVDDWGVDGNHDLTYVADALDRGDRQRAVEELDRQIGHVTAMLRAYLTLRHVLIMQDGKTLEFIREKDITNIADWPDRIEP